MPKEYPIRVDSKSSNMIVRICECGHAKAHHEIEIGKEEEHSNCNSCMCPQYHFEQELTMTKYIELERFIRMKNRNNSQ